MIIFVATLSPCLKEVQKASTLVQLVPEHPARGGGVVEGLVCDIYSIVPPATMSSSTLRTPIRNGFFLKNCDPPLGGALSELIDDRSKTLGPVAGEAAVEGAD